MTPMGEEILSFFFPFADVTCGLISPLSRHADQPSPVLFFFPSPSRQGEQTNQPRAAFLVFSPTLSMDAHLFFLLPRATVTGRPKIERLSTLLPSVMPHGRRMDVVTLHSTLLFTFPGKENFFLPPLDSFIMMIFFSLFIFPLFSSTLSTRI